MSADTPIALTPQVTVGAQTPTQVAEVSTTVPPVDNTSADFLATLPEGWAEKPFLKGVNDMNGLLTKFEGAQTLIGQRQNALKPPPPDADEATQKAYYDTIRPESVDVYTIDTPEGVEPDPDFLAKAKGIFLEAGLTPWQATMVQTKFDALAAEIRQGQEGQPPPEDVKFDELATEIFGADEKVALARSQELINKFTPDKMKAHVQNLGPDELIIMASILNGVHKEYIAEDGTTTTPTSGNSGATDLEGLSQERRTLFANPAYKNYSHPDHPKIMARLDEISALELKIMNNK